MGLAGTAQIVTIPDANFKAGLIARGVDTNTDGEIQESEASSVTELFLESFGISSLEGISYFTNLTTLYVSHNHLAGIDVSMLPNLGWLWCGDNNLIELNFTNNIYYLSCPYNNLTFLDINGLTGLQGLNVAYNHLTSLVLPNCEFNGDYVLNISGNLYTSIDLSPLHQPLETDFECYDTHLTSLKIIEPFLSIDIEDNPDLQTLDFKNDIFDGCVPIPGQDEPNGGCGFFYEFSFHILNNSLLNMVCVDDIALYETSEKQFFEDYFNNPAITVSNTCSLETINNESNLLKLFPNPTSGIINIEVTNNQVINRTSITNVLGQTILTFENETSLDISSLNKGTYFITIETDSGKETQRIIKY